MTSSRYLRDGAFRTDMNDNFSSKLEGTLAMISENTKKLIHRGDKVMNSRDVIKHFAWRCMLCETSH